MAEGSVEDLVLWVQSSDLATHRREDGKGKMVGTDQHGRRVLFGAAQREMDEFRRLVRTSGEVLTEGDKWTVFEVSSAAGSSG
jgi:hypothetical protein